MTARDLAAGLVNDLGTAIQQTAAQTFKAGQAYNALVGMVVWLAETDRTLSTLLDDDDIAGHQAALAEHADAGTERPMELMADPLPVTLHADLGDGRRIWAADGHTARRNSRRTAGLLPDGSTDGRQGGGRVRRRPQADHLVADRGRQRIS